MRQRKIRGLTKEKLSELGVITAPKKLNIENIYLEIGSGKGQFITKLAKDNPNNHYVALEKNMNVCLRIAEKQQELKLENLTIILDDSKNILEYINLESVSYLYLNFSDPWPKTRHHKRRLTYKTFLDLYQKILKKDAIFQFRTDHEAFFNDSVEYISKYFNLIDVNYNYQSDNYKTEYEIKRIEKGNLFQLKAGRKWNYMKI